jgi:hypothetical protein
MVRKAGENCVRAVDLFQSDDECEFVLEGQGTERPEQVRALDDALGKAVCASHDERASFSGIAFDFSNHFGEGAACESFSSLIENQAVAAFAATEQLGPLAKPVGGFDISGVNGAKALQSGEVFGDARAGLCEAGFTDGNNAPAQERS